MTFKPKYDAAAEMSEGTSLSTDGVRFAEQSANPVPPTAGEGSFYVKDTTPTTAVFVDSLGNEFLLGAATSGIGTLLTVAPSGAEYATITAALAAANSGEDLVLPDGVRIVGFPAAQNVITPGNSTTASRVAVALTLSPRT